MTVGSLVVSARLALVTAAAARGHDLDEPLLVTALAERGVAVAVVDWDDPQVDWSDFDRVILRSTWDYVERLDEFLAWARAVASTTELLNGIETIEFSIDKHYLQVFEAAGIPVTPTVFVGIGQEAVLPATTDGFIVKPAIGAGGRAVRRFAPTEASGALAHVGTVHERGVTAMIQPFLPLVAEHGEWPMVYIDGRFSHTASKRVTLENSVAGLYAREVNTSATATAAMRRVADGAMDLVCERLGAPLYARIDLVLGLDGEPCVLEAELVEPSLFLPEHPAAVATVADAFTRRLPPH